MIRACNQPDFLEDLTGITEQLKNFNMEDVENFEFNEEGDDF